MSAPPIGILYLTIYMKTSPADNGTICLNFEQLIDKIEARKKRLENALSTRMNFNELKRI